MELGLGHVVDVGLDETRGLALADERRRGGHDGLSARDVHDLEEEPRAAEANARSAAARERDAQRGDAQALDEPLHDAEVVHHLHEGDEEDDR